MKNLINIILIIITLSYSFDSLLSQTQLGSSLTGEITGDKLGEGLSISSNGQRIAVGAPANEAGYVQMFEWDGADWVKMGADIAGETPTDGLGNAVSLSSDGSRVALGSGANPGQSFLGGHVRIFEWDGTDWLQVGADIDGAIPGDVIGESVSLSGDGNRVAIGAPGNGANAGGFAMVFEWDGTNWVQLGTNVDGAVENDFFGKKIFLSEDGTRMVVGAPNNDSGYVQVFEWDGADWIKMGADITGETPMDGLGNALSLSSDGSRVALGSGANPGQSFLGGHVRIFEWDGTDWSQVGADIDGAIPGDVIGESVSLSGDGNRVAIGAPGNGVNGGGFAMLYEWDGLIWQQVNMNIEGEVSNDFLGSTTSLSADGTRLLVGAPNNDGGYAQVYDFSTISSTVSSTKEWDLNLYPNPTSGIIEWPEYQDATIHIVDNVGKIVLQKEMSNKTIDISHLPNGIYFIKIKSGERYYSEKVIKN